MMKPTISEVVELFAMYYQVNPTWGSLREVLCDTPDTSDNQLEDCTDYAIRAGDIQGYILGLILMQMSKTQRAKLPSKVQEYLDE